MKVLTQPIKANHALSFDGNHIEKHQDDEKIKCETFFIGFISGGRNARPREYPYQVDDNYITASKIENKFHISLYLKFFTKLGCSWVW